MVKVEMLVQVCINGRPIWRKAKAMKSEMTLRLEDREYARVVDAAIAELGIHVRAVRAAQEKVTVGK